MNDFLLDLRGKLLANRGLTNEEQIERFINPTYDRDLHDPFLMKDLKKAVARLLKAIKVGEGICIFGDYDADGVPATALLSDVFRRLGHSNFFTYIPHRHNEHFGLNKKAIKKIADRGAKVLITVDCGITDVEEVAYAKELGLDAIITDHHLLGSEAPKAFAIIDPKQPDCNYPDTMLCGTGIAFKIAQGLISEWNKKAKASEKIEIDFEKRLLDLVGVATIADRVPLVGENRALAKFGLMMLQRTSRPGLVELFKKLRLKQNFITEDDIAFTIAPSINAAGRMNHADEALNLLITSDPAEAVTLATNLVALNKDRKAMASSMMCEVEQLVESEELKNVVCVGDHSWSPGVISGIASKVLEKYSRPVCLWVANDEGEIRGSCRSDGTINMVELLEAAGGGEFFTDHGGHANAAGFGLQAGQEKEVAARLDEAWHKIGKQEVIKEIEPEAELLANDISWQLFDMLDQLAPFGEGNEKPIFKINKAPVCGAKTFGSTGAHFELQLENEAGRVIPAISFFNGQKLDKLNLTADSRPTVFANVEKSTFKWKPELRLRIVDIII